MFGKFKKEKKEFGKNEIKLDKVNDMSDLQNNSSGATNNKTTLDKNKKEAKPFSIESLRKKVEQERKKKHKVQETRIRSNLAKYYLQKAGIETEPAVIAKRLFFLAIFVTFLITALFLYDLAKDGEFKIAYLVIMLIIIWIGGFLLSLFIIWFIAFFIVDLRIYNRGKAIEDVLPDFLQLTAANINGGMPIDKALWYAVRPRFGILAKEIEMVAKEVVSGVELNEALQKFVSKYDSKVLKRAINLLTEGIESGGQVGELLNRIALDIKETQLMREEMAASVSNYTIFIAFSSVVAAPVLLALSGQLLGIISSVVSQIDIPKGVGQFSFSIGAMGLTQGQFRIFAVVMLLVTTLFSSIIISVILKGNSKVAVKYFMPFAIAAVGIFFGAAMFFESMLGSIF